MKRCPRCHTSMIWSSGSIEEGFPRLWHCLGCGREFLADEQEQARDDKLRDQLALAGGPRGERLY